MSFLQITSSRMLTAACLMLGGIVCLENWPGLHSMPTAWPVPLSSGTVATHPETSSGAHREAGAPAAAVLARTILARPLFMSKRRPPARAQALAGAITALPRLSGIVVAGTYRRAIFERSGKASIVAIGDRVDADRVVAIRSDAVTVGDGSHSETIRPGYDPARPTAAYTGPGTSIFDRLNLHQTQPVPLPTPPSLQQLMQRLGPH